MVFSRMFIHSLILNLILNLHLIPLYSRMQLDINAHRSLEAQFQHMFDHQDQSLRV